MIRLSCGFCDTTGEVFNRASWRYETCMLCCGYGYIIYDEEVC